MITIAIRVGSTILDEIEKVYQDIARRAYAKHLERCSAYALDIEDWLAAEKELLSKPDVQLTEKADLYLVKVELNLIDPASVDILATADDVLIQASPNSVQPRIFRAVHFPQPINPLQLFGTYVEGKLLLVAPKVATAHLLDPACLRA